MFPTVLVSNPPSAPLRIAGSRTSSRGAEHVDRLASGEGRESALDGSDDVWDRLASEPTLERRSQRGHTPGRGLTAGLEANVGGIVVQLRPPRRLR